ncbi:PREDICTED: uncharacterized protein LOC104745375 [Camelina sativa]|uniref:Uncharacterized protein LOC104745375 n=1 Tax=Camelina sativa TaxID=90675 RepID=A0ABM0W2U3_CAMSA|nr:PREDICTED: uncharacterized protein LOC104745375 [Camelina sativa]
MPRKKVKLARIENNQTRALTLKKKITALQKKVKELTILSDVRACLIISNPNEVKPVVWPSLETTHGLLDRFFALPKFVRDKYAMTVESYIEEETRKIQAQLTKVHNEKRRYEIDEMMNQLQERHITIADLSLSERYAMLSFSREKIISYRRHLHEQFPPLPDLPAFPVEVQVEPLNTTINDVFVGHNQDDERATRRISINALVENGSHYLFDQWVSPLNPPILEMDPNPRSYRPYQGSSSKGNHHLEMDPVYPQMMNSYGLLGSVSQPSQHHNMNVNPMMVNYPPRQYPFDIMSYDVGVNEEGNNMSSSQFYMSNNTSLPTNDGLRQEPQMMAFDGLHGSVSQPSQYHNPMMVMNPPRNDNTIATNDGLRQELPPNGPNGTITGEDNVDATLFNINNWLMF